VLEAQQLVEDEADGRGANAHQYVDRLHVLRILHGDDDQADRIVSYRQQQQEVDRRVAQREDL
jgi:hypothetical protein